MIKGRWDAAPASPPPRPASARSPLPARQRELPEGRNDPCRLRDRQTFGLDVRGATALGVAGWRPETAYD
jgi:hypothetical protein